MNLIISKLSYVAMFLFCLFFAFQNAKCQDNSIIEKYSLSLKSSSDSVRLVALKKICWGYRDSKPTLGMNYGLQALEIARENKWDFHIAEIYNFLGVINRNMGNYDKALNYYFKALQMYSDTTQNFPHGAALNNIGNLYYRMGFYKEAIHFTGLAHTIFENINSDIGIAYSYNQFGIIYQGMDSLYLALYYHTKALSIRLRIGHKNGIATSYWHFAEIYILKAKYVEADLYLKKAISLYKSINSINGEASCLLTYGRLAFAQKKYKKANLFYEKAISLAKQINAPDIELKALEWLKRIAVILNQEHLALRYFQEYSKINDSLLNVRFGFQLAQLSKEMEVENRLEIRKLEAEQKLKLRESTIKDQKSEIFLISAFLFVVLILLVAVLYYAGALRRSLRYMAEQKDEIQDKNEELRQLTEEIRAQADQLERANTELEKLSIVARETNNAVVITDKKLELSWANESFSRFYGLSLDEFKRQRGDTLYDVSANPEIHKLIDLAISSNKSVQYSNEYKFRDGRSFWTQTALTPIVSEEGKLEKMIAIDSDISELKAAKDKIEFQNKEITSSISYAGQLQKALLPMPIFIDALLNEYFILYYPKDIVSGDFYWLTRKKQKNIIAVADCTGHGIPGAFMTALSLTLLRNTISKTRSDTPNILLDELRLNLIKTLHQRNKEGSLKDGFDISLVYFDTDTYILEYAGANLPIVIVRNKKAIRLKPSKMPVGVYDKDNEPFALQEFQLQAGDMVYMFSDGFVDQFGGERNKKYMRKRLISYFEQIANLETKQQKRSLAREFVGWKGENEQVDDVLVLGFRV